MIIQAVVGGLFYGSSTIISSICNNLDHGALKKKCDVFSQCDAIILEQMETIEETHLLKRVSF